MIVGDGDIASVLPNRPDLLFFASGVSNSQEKRESEYKREKDLLLGQDPNIHTVYFSSLSIFSKRSRYTEHKKEMEEIVINRFARYTIVRLGNILWGDNPNTLINFMKNQIAKGEKLEVRDEYKYLVDIGEFLYWINLIPGWSCELNIPGERMKVAEIVERYIKK